jgi:hypothetical protein
MGAAGPGSARSSRTVTDVGPDDTALALLHELRLRGMIEGLEGDRAAGRLIADGMAVPRGRFLALTPMGREGADARGRLPGGSGQETAARRAYDAFLPLNAELLKVTTDWQVGPGGAPNDHDDASYDWDVIGRLEAIDERAGPIVHRVANEVERFAGYRRRLQEALVRVKDGDHQWFASPRCDSYHTVWMLLHEDLLLALGLARAGEPAG